MRGSLTIASLWIVALLLLASNAAFRLVQARGSQAADNLVSHRFALVNSRGQETAEWSCGQDGSRMRLFGLPSSTSTIALSARGGDAQIILSGSREQTCRMGVARYASLSLSPGAGRDNPGISILNSSLHGLYFRDGAGRLRMCLGLSDWTEPQFWIRDAQGHCRASVGDVFLPVPSDEAPRIFRKLGR